MLGAVDKQIKGAGGTLMAISADEPEDARRIAERFHLEFPVLADPKLEVISAYALRHVGGYGGRDIAAPAHFLIGTDGKVKWRFISHRQQERAGNEADIGAIEALKALSDR